MKDRKPIDPPYYTEEELDALYEQDPIQALKISREQTLLRKQLEAAPRIDPNASMPTKEAVQLVLEEARRILLRDGGDLEFVALRTGLSKGPCERAVHASMLRQAQHQHERLQDSVLNY